MSLNEALHLLEQQAQDGEIDTALSFKIRMAY
jgi:hypothetical protein